MKNSIIDILHKKTKLKKEEIETLLEIPPSYEMGDFAFPCFAIAKQFKKSPVQVAIDLKDSFTKLPNGISEIHSNGPYLNFFLDRKTLAKTLVEQILKQKNNFGKQDFGKNKKILVEFSSPNIAKPFGIGHLRSTIIGNSLANISEFLGYDVVRINYPGDWGTQFGKLIVGYKKFLDKKKLEKEPIKHLLELYVKANAEEYAQEARDWFKKLESGDKEATELWTKFRETSLKDFQKLYDKMGIKFDVISGESKYNKEMQEVLHELNKKEITKESDNALIVDLEEYKLGVAPIQKSDGATLYITRDLAAAIDRYKKFKFEKSIYEVGQEQELHFKQVFKILELMGNKWAKDCIHVGHGLYLDKDGKKFATRKGKTVFMEDVFQETKDLAQKEIKQRFPILSKKELEFRAEKVALAAIFYGDLKNFRRNNIVFDLDKFVSFEGNTGPYLLYSYARANSILKKANYKQKKFEIENLEDKEIKLAKKLSEFDLVVKKSFENLSPNLIANYAYELAQIFNEFYHECPVINSENENFRLSLVASFKQVLANSLNLLGIEPLEQM